MACHSEHRFSVHAPARVTCLLSAHITAQVGAFLRTSKGARGLLLAVVLLATSMIIGDGVLTPAISVISAVIGIQVAAPSITTGAT
jgi:K+ transporter